MSAVEPAEGGVRIAVRVQPRASRSEVAGLHGEQVRIRLAAPPVDGAANEALVRFLADLLGVPARRVTLAAGHASRSKVVRVEGIDAGAAARKLGIG
ncbi:MAG TPA: DUF167 domain-containing protein [Gemmatimonadales bacterium]